MLCRGEDLNNIHLVHWKNINSKIDLLLNDLGLVQIAREIIEANQKRIADVRLRIGFHEAALRVEPVSDRHL